MECCGVYRISSVAGTEKDSSFRYQGSAKNALRYEVYFA